jgi:Zn-dependent peptidase ImmA (M78 family)/transcriptional regulator with XRE-family HTH domain
MTSAPLNAEILLVARESRGCSQKDVALAAGVTQGLISKAENAVATIAPDDLKKIADFLGYPIAIFYEPGQIRGVGSACLYHRKRKTLPATLLKRLDAQMFVRNINVRRLLNGLDIEGDRTFHTLDPDEYGGSPVEVARALRSIWRIAEGPIPNLTALIESAGGIVIFDDFGTRKLFGMSCWAGRDRPLFYLNSAMAPEDIRWTMAHELGHLTMHASAPLGDPELEADDFAGELLAPASVTKPLLRQLDFHQLPTCKQYLRISMKAVIRRAQRLGAIDQAKAVRLYKQYSARGYNTREPYTLSPEPATLIHDAIRVQLAENEYTPETLAEAVRLNYNEFAEKLMGAMAPIAPANIVNLFGDRAPLPSA